MARSTQSLRDAWGKPCSRKETRGAYDAYQALDIVFKHHDFRVLAGQTGARNCRRITGGSGYSLHAWYLADAEGRRQYYTFWTGVRIAMGLAIDVNWQLNPYNSRHTQIRRQYPDMVPDIVSIKTVDGVQVWQSGVLWSRPDDMHKQINATPDELARGIDWDTLPGAATDKEEVEMFLTKDERDEAIWLIGPDGRRWIKSSSTVALYERGGVQRVKLDSPEELDNIRRLDDLDNAPEEAADD